MGTRLILAAVCILALPLLFSASPEGKLASSAPFGTVVYAGHTTFGDWCACGIPDCICDVVNRSNNPVPDQAEVLLNQGASPIREHSRPGFDYGTGALMLALALFVWTRLRA